MFSWLCYIIFLMSDAVLVNKEDDSDSRILSCMHRTSFHYQMTELKARKILVLIKFSQLDYAIQEMTDLDSSHFMLKTSQGELYNEYQIINYIVNDNFLSQVRKSQKQNGVTETPQNSNLKQQKIVSLCGNDIYLLAKMNEKLYELRKNFFPLLEEFYPILLGHEKIRKSKYDLLLNKIKKYIFQLDKYMSQQSQMFNHQYSFLTIIIVCEIFIACKFVFEEKFRKSKWALFNKFQNIVKKNEFQEVFGKASFCVKETLAMEFEDQQDTENKKVEESIPIQIVKLVESPLVHSQGLGYEKRNQLLYNFFKNTLKGKQSKSNYFPYFWLMYDNLICNLIEIHYNGQKQNNYQELQKSINLALPHISKVTKSIDYGFLGIYLKQKDRHCNIEGLICLGSQVYQQFAEEWSKINELKVFKLLKVDVTNEQSRKKVQNLWQHQVQGNIVQGTKLSLLKDF